MKQGKLVILDPDREYGKRLGEYFNICDWMVFQAEVFSEAEAMEAYIQKWKPELILVNETMMKEEYRKYPLFVLNETLLIAEMDSPRIYKYQSAREIGKEIMSWYAGQGKRNVRTGRRKNLRIYGVYSMDRKREKAVLAWEMGKYLARKSSTLYVNLEAFSGMEGYFGDFSGASLSDLFYFIRQNRGNPGMKLQGMAEAVGELQVLPPFRAWEDALDINQAEWQKFMEEIETETSYQNLVLEISEISADLSFWLQVCDKVFIIASENNGYSQMRLKEMQTFFQSRMEAYLLEKWEICPSEPLQQGKDYAREHQEGIQLFVEGILHRQN